MWENRRPEHVGGSGRRPTGEPRTGTRRFTELGGSLLRIIPLSFVVLLSSPVKRNRTTLHESVFRRASCLGPQKRRVIRTAGDGSSRRVCSETTGKGKDQ